MNRWICMGASGAPVALAGVLLLATGCAGRQAAWEADKPVEKAEAEDAGQASAAKDHRDKGDAAWAERGKRERLEEAIKHWEKAVEIEEDYATLVKLSKAYYMLADGFIFFDDVDMETGEVGSDHKEEMLAAYEKGTDYAERALVVQSPEFAKKMEGGAKLEEAISVIGKDGMPAMYWYATNLGKFAKAKGFTVILFHKDRIKAMMDHVLGLDPAFNHAAPHRYFGAFYAVAPAFAGGDLNKSKEHFEKSLELAPDYLATRVLYASLYAPKAQDEALFDAQLDKVLSTPTDAIPGLTPELEIEHKKAKLLKKQKGDLF